MASSNVPAAGVDSTHTPAFVRRAVAFLLARYADLPVRIVLWDGSRVEPKRGSPLVTLVLHSRTALLRLLTRPSLEFGECYRDGSLEIEGDLLALLEAVNRRSVPQSTRLSRMRTALQQRSRRNSRSHYELGSDFYRLWLDSRMVYTCAYFESAGVDLEQAQLAKLDLVCRKLRLRAGETVVEAGSGWGALALYMARRYGVVVRAFNTSSDQIAYAKDEAARYGLSHRVEFVEEDYRCISGHFDAFVSVGLLEHVGRRNYAEFGGIMRTCLGCQGRGFLQTIGRDQTYPTNPWIRKRIFPGGYTPSLKEVTGVFECNDLSVLHLENLRYHYAETLGQWRDRFESASAEVADMFDEAFVRTWRLYLTAAEAAFRTGWLQLFQVVFAPTTNPTPRSVVARQPAD